MKRDHDQKKTWFFSAPSRRQGLVLGIMGIGILGLGALGLGALGAMAQSAPPQTLPNPPQQVPPSEPSLPPSIANTAPPEEVAPPEDPQIVETPKVPEKPPVDPAVLEKRVRHEAAVLQVLDKATGETMRFEAHVGQPIRYRSIVFTVRSCETSAPVEPMREASAYVEMRSEPRGGQNPVPARDLFKGWIFTTSPGINGLEHPVYDAWLMTCKTPSPSA